MDKQTLIHKAEEYGQSRAYTADEVKAVERAMVIAGVYGAGVAVAIAGGVLLYEKVGLGWTLAIMLPPAGFLIGAGSVLIKGINEQLDGLRTFRSIETYTPPIPELQPEPPHPPVLVRPYGGESYVLDNPDRPALPGREEAMAITPNFVASVLQAVIEEYGGEWSRRKLTALRIGGRKVTRGTWRELTNWLHQAGILLQQPQGGYTLPPDVSEFEDLRLYFPNLPGLGGLGGQPGGLDTGAAQVAHPQDGEVLTLAERRRRLWLECNCDVNLYQTKKRP